MKKRKILFLIAITIILTLSGCKKELKCEEGYVLKDKLCYKEVTRTNATEEYSCNESYTLNKENDKCEKTEIIEADTKYTCKSGYNLDGTKCTGRETINANAAYNCDGIGGTLDGSKCISRAADIQALICTKYCASGTYDSETGKCKSVAPITGRITYHDQICKYSCARGTMIGSMCYVDYARNANVVYSCNSGYTLNGSKCYKNVTINATSSYTCQEGYILKNNKCEKIVEDEKITNYKCDNNYVLEGNMCILYDIKDAN